MLEGKEKEKRVRSIFQKISSCYDTMNDIITLGIHRVWKKRLIKSIPMESRDILDVCCGTGDVSIGLGKYLENSQVTAMDFSSASLRADTTGCPDRPLIHWPFCAGTASPPGVPTPRMCTRTPALANSFSFSSRPGSSKSPSVMMSNELTLPSGWPRISSWARSSASCDFV